MDRHGYFPKPVSDLRRYVGMPDADIGRLVAKDKPLLFNQWLYDYAYADFHKAVKKDWDRLNPGQGESRIPFGGYQQFLDWGSLDPSVWADFGQYMREGPGRQSITKALRPSAIDFKETRLVKKEWLVHFTDSPFKVAVEGFKLGVNDPKYLSLTESLPSAKKQDGGYNFAYLADDAENYLNSYGRHCVLFMGSGVLFAQHADDDQVIFQGNTAKYLIPIYNDIGIWQVKSGGRGDHVLFQNNSLGTVIEWCKTNLRQYLRKLVPMETRRFLSHQMKADLRRRCAAMIPRLAVQVHEDLMDAITNPNRHVRAWAAQQQLPFDAQQALAQDDEMGVRVHLAENTTLHPQVMLTLAADVQPVVLALARNPEATPDTLKTIYQHFHKDLGGGGSPVIWSLAEHPNTDPGLLESFVRADQTYSQRNAITYRFVAANPNTPTDTLWTLWEYADAQADELMLSALQANPGVPQDLMTEVAYSLSH
jgi:hypothetical protein